MASLTDEIADALARDTLRAAEELGDDDLITEISRAIGASSTTTQEAFMTFVRVRLSEKRARKMLAEKVGADWPLQIATPGGAALVQVVQPVAAVAATPAPAQREQPAAVEPVPVSRDPAPAPSLVSPPVESPPAQPAPPSPVYRDSPMSVGVSREEAAAPAVLAQPEAAAPPIVAHAIRPRIPTPLPKREPMPVKKSFEAALALATSLPRKPLPQPERTYDAEPLEPGIEIPDGDWG